MPCLVLNHFAVVSCSLQLLEHASWAVKNNELTKEVDIEAFRRWVEEGDLAKFEREIERVREDKGSRVVLDSSLVYGSATESSKL